jgi:hypothetical protein
MNFLIVVIGIILINAMFGLIPSFYPDSDPGIIIPYQFWINTLLFLTWLLPSTKGKYLFGKYDTEEDVVEAEVDEPVPAEVDEPVSSWDEQEEQGHHFRGSYADE